MHTEGHGGNTSCLPAVAGGRLHFAVNAVCIYAVNAVVLHSAHPKIKRNPTYEM
jgi:hypothetical protein